MLVAVGQLGELGELAVVAEVALLLALTGALAVVAEVDLLQVTAALVVAEVALHLHYPALAAMASLF